jgi:transposase
MGTSRPAIIETVPTSKTRTGKRHHRSADEKVRIVEETLAPGASVARIARARGVNANQVFQWRRLYHAGKLGNSPIRAAARLLPVSVSDVAPKGDTILPAANESTELSIGGGEAAPGLTPGAIHLELHKARLRIEGNVDPAVLRLVLKAVLG